MFLVDFKDFDICRCPCRGRDANVRINPPGASWRNPKIPPEAPANAGLSPRATAGAAILRVRLTEMVLLGRIELPTSALPRMRSTTELQQRYHSASQGPAEFWPGADRRALLPPPRALSTGGLSAAAVAGSLPQWPKIHPSPRPCPSQSAKIALPPGCATISRGARRRRGRTMRRPLFPKPAGKARARAFPARSREHYPSCRA